MELLREGKIWKVYFDNENKNFVVKSEHYEHTYVVNNGNKAMKIFNECERYKK